MLSAATVKKSDTEIVAEVTKVNKIDIIKLEISNLQTVSQNSVCSLECGVKQLSGVIRVSDLVCQHLPLLGLLSPGCGD